MTQWRSDYSHSTFVVGLTLAAHGAQKLFGAFGGPGGRGTAGFFNQIGLRPGKLHAVAAGGAELFGGLLIALGLFTPFAAAALIGVMTAAVITVVLPNGFFSSTRPGYEYNVVLVAALFALAATGTSEVSLARVLDVELAGTGWALGALGAGILGGLGAVRRGRLAARQPTGPSPPHAA
jgi:putative oxidoreductase